MKYLTTQKYSECQLVTAVNASYYYGGPEVDKKLYEFLVDLVGARHGSAINVGFAYKMLGLLPVKIPPFYWALKLSLQIGIPVELPIWHKSSGFHSVLAVDSKGLKVRVLNTKAAPNEWIKWGDLRKLVRRGNLLNVGPCNGWFRAIRKIGDRRNARDIPN